MVRERVEERVRRGVVAPGPASRAPTPPRRTARRSRAADRWSARAGSRRRPPWAPAPSRSAPRSAAPATPSSSTPAACTTPRSGGMPRGDAGEQRGDVVVVARRRACDDHDVAPRRPRARAIARAPRRTALAPPTAPACRAPRSTSHRATRKPERAEAAGDQIGAVGADRRPSPAAASRRLLRSTILPMCLACAMKRNASAACAERERRAAAAAAARPIRTSRHELARASTASVPGSTSPEIDRRSTTTSDRSRGDICSALQMPRLPISRNRPPGAQRAEALRDELAGQRVQDDVDAFAAGAPPGSRRRSRATASPSRGRRRATARYCALLGAAGGGEDLRAGRCASCTAASPTPPVPAWISTRSPAHRARGGSARTRRSGTRSGSSRLPRRVSVRGLRDDERRRVVTYGAKRPASPCHDFVADREPVDTRRRRATTVPAHSLPSGTGIARIHAERVEHVAEIQTGGLRRGSRPRPAPARAVRGLQLQIVEDAALGDSSSTGRSAVRATLSRAAAHQPRDMNRPPARNATGARRRAPRSPARGASTSASGRGAGSRSTQHASSSGCSVAIVAASPTTGACAGATGGPAGDRLGAARHDPESAGGAASCRERLRQRAAGSPQPARASASIARRCRRRLANRAPRDARRRAAARPCAPEPRAIRRSKSSARPDRL